MRFLTAFCFAGLAVTAACGGSVATSTAPAPFTSDDCPARGLVELARIPNSGRGLPGLYLRGGNVYFSRAVYPHGMYDDPGQYLAVTGVPAAGGAPRDVATLPEGGPLPPHSNEPQTFAVVESGAILLTGGGEVRRLEPSAGAQTIPFASDFGMYESSVADADAIYVAYAGGVDPTGKTSGASVVHVQRTPLAGGAATVVYERTEANISAAAIVDAGDAVLLPIAWDGQESTDASFTRLLRIPKDGGPATEVRPDLDFEIRNFGTPAWQNVAWDGTDVVARLTSGPTVARIPPNGTGWTPTRVPFFEAAARSPDGVVMLDVTRKENRVIVTSSGPAGDRVVACGAAEDGYVSGGSIASDATGTYVSYTITLDDKTPDTLVIARAP